MNKNRILKTLQRKHNDFLNSIDDKDVRKLVADNTIVTGGCITSLLLDEYPNDFDYYFTNKETAKRVAEYYVKKFIEQNPLTKDAEGKTQYPEVIEEENRIRIRIKSAGVVGENTDGEDYQYFESASDEEGEAYIEQAIETVTDADNVEVECTEELPKYRPLFLTDNAITLSDKVQLVIRFFGNPKEIHSNFDFVHCTNYYLPRANKLKLSKRALESILTKEFKYVGSKYPLCSIIRLRKFIKRGWWINAGEILKICFQLSLLDLQDVNVLEEQLVGVDTAYFLQLISRLKERQEDNKHFRPSQCYIATLVDRIFGV